MIRNLSGSATIVLFALCGPLNAQTPTIDVGGFAGLALADYRVSSAESNGEGYFAGVRVRYLLSEPEEGGGLTGWGFRARGQIATLNIGNYSGGGRINYTQIAGGIEIAWIDGKGGAFYTSAGPSFHINPDCGSCGAVQVGGIWGIGREWTLSSGSYFNVHLEFDIGGPRTFQGEKKLIDRLGIGYSVPVG